MAALDRHFPLGVKDFGDCDGHEIINGKAEINSTKIEDIKPKSAALCSHDSVVTATISRVAKLDRNSLNYMHATFFGGFMQKIC